MVLLHSWRPYRRRDIDGRPLRGGQRGGDLVHGEAHKKLSDQKDLSGQNFQKYEPHTHEQSSVTILRNEDDAKGDAKMHSFNRSSLYFFPFFSFHKQTSVAKKWQRSETK